jgi:hypothetical protein
VQELVAKILEERTIHLYCDFHAHSRKYNMFMYGCENRKRHGTIISTEDHMFLLVV